MCLVNRFYTGSRHLGRNRICPGQRKNAMAKFQGYSLIIVKKIRHREEIGTLLISSERRQI